MSLNHPHALTRIEAARLLRISASALDRHIQAGLVPAVRLGRRVLIPLDAVYSLAGVRPGTSAMGGIDE